MSEPTRGASSAARLAWMVSGLVFFIVGVVLSLVQPDNIAVGIVFLAVGVVFFSLSGRKQPPSV